MKCTKCGFELISESKKSEIIIRCPQCGWTAVTTCMSEIADDITKYHIVVHKGNRIDKDLLKLISKKTNNNILKTRKLLVDGGVLVEEFAVEIRKIAHELDLLGVEYHIDPEFPY